MPSFCAAVGCSNSSSKEFCQGISFHRFPTKDEKLLKEWTTKMKRKGFEAKSHSFLCSEHFESDCFVYQAFTNRRGLKPGSIPSKFAHMEPKTKRNRNSYQFAPSFGATETSAPEDPVEDLGKASQTDEDAISALLSQLNITENKLLVAEASRFCFMSVSKDESLFYNITGFSPMVFETVYLFLNIERVNDRYMDPREQFFIFLVRIRSGVTIDFLGGVFNTPKTTISRIVSDMIGFVYTKLKMLDIWPSKAQIQEYMPEAFYHAYPNCRIILDSTEIGIQKPSNPRLQQITFSTYKNKNTLKALVGITPSGAVSYISDLWCGGISDKQIFLRSGLLDKLENDTILVDRGFTIEKEVAKKNCKLVMPHFLKKNIQFTIQQRSENKSVSHLRVHVERAISRIKKYRYFKGPIPAQCFHEVNKVFFIVTSFTNFSDPLIKIY